MAKIKLTLTNGEKIELNAHEFECKEVPGLIFAVHKNFVGATQGANKIIFNGGWAVSDLKSGAKVCDSRFKTVAETIKQFRELVTNFKTAGNLDGFVGKIKALHAQMALTEKMGVAK